MNDIAYYVDSINFCRREKFASVQCSFPLKGQYHYLLQYSQTSVLYLQLAVVVCGGRAEIIILFLSPVVNHLTAAPWGGAHCSPWCKKRGGFWRSNFKKWETLRSSFHKLRTSLFHCRVQNRGPESARDLFSLTQDLTFLNYWHRNRGPEFTHAFFSTLNGTKEANTSLMPFLDSRLKIPQWKEIIHYDSHEEKALPSCES